MPIANESFPRPLSPPGLPEALKHPEAERRSPRRLKPCCELCTPKSGLQVSRTFLQAGAAAGTVARSISAYDMKMSDLDYGKVGPAKCSVLPSLSSLRFFLSLLGLLVVRGMLSRCRHFSDSM